MRGDTRRRGRRPRNAIDGRRAHVEKLDLACTLLEARKYSEDDTINGDRDVDEHDEHDAHGLGLGLGWRREEDGHEVERRHDDTKLRDSGDKAPLVLEAVNARGRRARNEPIHGPPERHGPHGVLCVERLLEPLEYMPEEHELGG